MRLPVSLFQNFYTLWSDSSFYIGALQSFCWTFAAFSVSWSYTQSVRLLGRGISPSQGRYLHTEEHKHRINAHRHPCLEWDSKPRSRRWNERSQFMSVWSGVEFLIPANTQKSGSIIAGLFSLPFFTSMWNSYHLSPVALSAKQVGFISVM
jgi:hypothetical protein